MAPDSYASLMACGLLRRTLAVHPHYDKFDAVRKNGMDAVSRNLRLMVSFVAADCPSRDGRYSRFNCKINNGMIQFIICSIKNDEIQ